jgi:hypothetical protein
MRRLNVRYILGPVDFSPLSAASLSFAVAIARARNAEVSKGAPRDAVGGCSARFHPKRASGVKRKSS